MCNYFRIDILHLNIWSIRNKWKYSITRPNWQVGEKSIRTHLISVIIVLINVSVSSLLWQRSATRRRKWNEVVPNRKTKPKIKVMMIIKKKIFFFLVDYTVYRITFIVRLSHTMRRFLGDNEHLVACISSPVEPDDLVVATVTLGVVVGLILFYYILF